MAETAIMERTEVVRRGRRLEYFTVTSNALEGLVGVIAGALAGSISLVGFGIASFIEVASGAALLWRMSVDADVHKPSPSNQSRSRKAATFARLPHSSMLHQLRL